MKAFLGSQECLDIVQHGYDEPESKEVEDALQEARSEERRVGKECHLTCRSHQDELTAARISFIGDGGSPHAPPEDSAQKTTRSPRVPEVDDECRPRAPYTRLAEPFTPCPSRASSRVQPSREPLRTSRRAASAPKEYSRFNPANRPPYRIGFWTSSPIF